jgi:aryl-alcohol dehydrogenase-like predicted oxidoreductase
MRQRRFGRTGWLVSEVGYGMWGMGGDWKGSDDDQSLKSLQRAVDLGCSFFDTAWAYGSGHSEALLGRLLRQNPGVRLYTATKTPPRTRCWPSRREHSLEESYPAGHVVAYLEKSLANAGVARFDLLQLHTWEDGWLGDDAWIRDIERLKRDGKIGAFGISLNRWEPWNGIEAVRSGLVDAVQVIYNVFEQRPKDALFPACREHDVAVIARVPFDEGTLTGTLTLDSTWPEGDWRNSYFVPENLKASVDHAEALRPLVPGGMTLPGLALRFILAEPTVSTVIPGMRRLANVEANMAASDAGPLHGELLAAVEKHRWDREPTEWSQ